jgi:putative oxygen-independent coproporphyrinogen III oxidase
VSTRRGLPLALYVHLPWCVSKCPYCDFNSHATPAAGIPRNAYLGALLDDLAFATEGLAGREISSVFFGGGTPSLFAAEAIAAVLQRARQLLPVVADVEVTLEANPGTVEHGAFAGYRDAGVNRVSLGAQSFDDRHLASLGRIHAHGEIEAAVEELRIAGLVNFNLDLMYGLPRQTLEEALLDVDRAIHLAPMHISHYQLTLEPGTAFEKRPPELPDDETVFAMQGACQERLAAAGYRQYEVSAYARSGRECRHNLNYWRFGDYVGVGAGAHGKTTDPGTFEVTRTERVKQPGRYLSAAKARDRLAAARVIEEGDLPFEFFLNVLRLTGGFEASLFKARTGLSLETVSGELARARERGLIEESATGHWAPTPLGRLFLNDLQAIFLPGAAAPGGR